MRDKDQLVQMNTESYNRHTMISIPRYGIAHQIFRVCRYTSVFIFVFLLPTQLAKHYWPSWSYVQGIAIDYLAIKISALDILSIVIVALHFRQLYALINNDKQIRLIIVLLVLLNSYFALREAHTLLLWIGFGVHTLALLAVIKNYKKYLTVIMIGLATSVVIQILLVMMQFTSQSSIQGVWYWLGERKIVMSLPDIAKIYVNGREFLRPYGTFSHPNALGGFYMLLFFFMIWFKKNILSIKFHKLCANIVIFVCPYLILSSFSKTAIIGFVIGSVMLIVNDDIYRKCKFCLVARILGLSAITFVFIQLSGDPDSLTKRWALIQNALGVIALHPLWGVGLGNYVASQATISMPMRFGSLFQPVHNALLLVISEVGIGGLTIVYMIGRRLKVVGMSITMPMYIVIPLIATMMMDHYWVTATQNQTLLIFVALFLIVKASNKTDVTINSR